MNTIRLAILATCITLLSGCDPEATGNANGDAPRFSLEGSDLVAVKGGDTARPVKEVSR